MIILECKRLLKWKPFFIWHSDSALSSYQVCFLFLLIYYFCVHLANFFTFDLSASACSFILYNLRDVIAVLLIILTSFSCSLETTLRNYSCLTTGDSIMVAYNNKKYYIDIIETKPSNAISIIETDCEVDFAPPLDYKEPVKPIASASSKATAKGEKFF